VPTPTATWNPARGVWETPETNLFCEHAGLFSETWPVSGMTRSGRLFPRPTLAPRTAANGCSSSRGLLPTPQARDGAGAKTPEQIAVMRARGHGVSNLNEVAPTLLKTPTAQLAVNGGSQHPDKRRAGGHGPTLADQIEHLLPTPRATDGTKGGPNQRGSAGDLMLPSAVQHLLPTPAARDWKSGQSNMMDRNARPLNEVVEMLLPTPGACDWKGSGQTQGRTRGGRPRSPGDKDLPEAIALLPTPRASDGLGGTAHNRSWSTTDRSLHTLIHTGELGAPTSQLSDAGKPPSGAPRQAQLSPGEPETA